MGIDPKSIGVCVLKCLKFSMTTSYRFALKYPFVSGIFLLVLFLYIFLPSAFLIAVYSSPFLALAVVVVVRVYLKSKRPKPQNVKEVEKKKRDETQSGRCVAIKNDDIIILRNDGTAISRQMSRRRNFKDRNKLGWNAQAGKDKNGKDLVSLTASLRELLGLTPQIVEEPKVVLEVKEIVSLDGKDGSTAEKVLKSESWSKPDFTSHNRSPEQPHKIDGIGDAVEGGDNNKAVEWMEDDEIERHKRLEILIAKRRARKLTRLQDGESPIGADLGRFPLDDIEIAPIMVSRTKPFDHYAREDSSLPGSAPPVLLPSRNPFDLPYDPHEEKPNLTGDSFHEEFTATQPKDLFLCRHESFRLGSFFQLEPTKERRDSILGPYFGTAYRESEGLQPKKEGDHDQLAEQLFSVEVKSMSHDLSTQDLVKEDLAHIQETNSLELQHEEDKETGNGTTQSQGEGIENSQDMESGLSMQSEVQTKTDAADASNRESSASSSSSSSSSSDEDHIFNANIAGVAVSLTSKGRNFPNVIQPIKKPLACSIPKKAAGKDHSSLSAEDKAKRDEYLFFLERSYHARSYSLASDMQVEVSEDGSPPSIVNESFAYDGDSEKEIGSGSEDFGGASPRIGRNRTEKLRLSSGEVNDVGEEASTEAGFSGANKGSADQTASFVHPEASNQQYLTDTNFSPPTGTEIPESGQSILVDSDHKIQDKDNQSTEEIGNSGASTLSLECGEAEQSKKLEDADEFPVDGKVDNENISFDKDSKEESDTDGASQNLAEKKYSSDSSGTLTDMVPNHQLLQSSTAPYSVARNLNETIMNEIMNEEKLKSIERCELESQASIIGEPVPETLAIVEELSSTSVRAVEGESLHSSDAIQSVSGDSEGLTIVNDGRKGQSEVESEATLLEKLILEPLANEESKSRSTKDIEGVKHNSDAIPSFKGESEGFVRDNAKMENQVNKAPTAELPKPTRSEVMVPKPELNDDHEVHNEVESQASITGKPASELFTSVQESYSMTTRGTESESQHSPEAFQCVKSEPTGLTKDNAEKGKGVNHELTSELSKPTGSEHMVSKPGHKGQSEVGSQATIVAEHFPESLSTVDESNPRSTKDVEDDSNQSVKGESEA